MLERNSAPTQKAAGTTNPLKIAAALRGGLDIAAPGLAFGAELLQGTNNPDTNTSTAASAAVTNQIPTATVRLAWMVTEFSFFLIMTAYFVSRYCLNNKSAKNNPSANNLLTMRVVIMLCSATAASLLASDLEGETYRSLAGIILIALTSFLVDSMDEKFEQPRTQTDLFRHSIYQLPEGKTFNLDHTFTPSDMALLWQTTVIGFSNYTDQENDTHYALTRTHSDYEQLFVTPPITKLGRDTGYYRGIGYNNLGLYFNNTLSHTLDRSIFDDIDNISEIEPYTYKILIPAQGYTEGHPTLWSTIEVQIHKRYLDRNNHFNITIYNHSPLGGGRLLPDDYCNVARAIHTQLTDTFHIETQNIHFKSQDDLTHENNNNNLNIAEVIPADQIPESPYTQPRLQATDTTYSSMAALKDLTALLHNTTPSQSGYRSQNLRRMKQQIIRETLTRIPEEQRRTFTSRVVIPSPATYASLEQHRI
jgi:hypothetical protein